MNSFFSPSLSSLCQEAATHTLHLWFTFIAWISIQYCPFYSLKKNSRLDHRFKKIMACSVLNMCSPCVLISVITRLTFSICWLLRTLKVTLAFPAKDTWGMKTGCALPLIIMLVLARRWFCSDMLQHLQTSQSKYDFWFVKHEQYNEI